jgi:hypothetical protein
MNKPHLILRLCKPHGPIPNAPENARGYYLQEGKREPDPERSNFINSALKCDYMGSAEFEFGSVPKAFREMALRGAKGELELKVVVFEGTPDGGTESQQEAAHALLLAPKSDVPELLPILEDLAKANIPSSYRTKEVPYIQQGLFGKMRPDRENRKKMVKVESEYIGWFDLDNHWFLTKSKEQMEALIYLLGFVDGETKPS